MWSPNRRRWYMRGSSNNKHPESRCIWYVEGVLRGLPAAVVTLVPESKQRAEDRLKAAAAVETDTAAIRAEKEEWSLVFARALKEDQTAASFKVQLKGLKAKEGQGGERGLRPTPLTALRLLREAQEERSLSVKVDMLLLLLFSLFLSLFLLSV